MGSFKLWFGVSMALLSFGKAQATLGGTVMHQQQQLQQQQQQQMKMAAQAQAMANSHPIPPPPSSYMPQAQQHPPGGSASAYPSPGQYMPGGSAPYYYPVPPHGANDGSAGGVIPPSAGSVYNIGNNVNTGVGQPQYNQHHHGGVQYPNVVAASGGGPSRNAGPGQQQTASGKRDKKRDQHSHAHARHDSVGHNIAAEEWAEFEKDFREYDSNGDMLIDAQELRQAFRGIKSNEIHSFFGEVDTNESGTISLEEYRNYAISLE